MLVPEPTIVRNETKNKDFWYNDQMQQLFRAVANLQLTAHDGSIQHGDKAGNLAAAWVVFTSNGTADTEDAVTHTLGRIPLGYIVAGQDKAAILYDGLTAWTDTTIYLKSSATSVAWTVLVF